MKHLLPGLLLSLAFGCSGGVEIPPVEIGGPSGARLMNGQAKSPYDAYDMAYSQLTKQHLNVRRNLEPRGRNLYGAEVAMEMIIDSIRTMRSLVPPADQPKYDPYLARYQEWLRDIQRNTWGGSFLSDFDQTEREVKSRFNPGSVEIVAEFPGAAAAREAAPARETAPPKPPAPRDPSAGVPADKVEVPARKPAPPSESPTVKPPETPPAAPPAATETFRIYYLAWDRAHDKLVEAYKNKQDCRSTYNDLAAALKLMRGQLPAKRAEFLDYWVGWYARVHETTKGFTALPEKTTENDIVNELNVASNVLRKEFNPDK